MSPRHRLAVVLSHPVQYYSPWFRWIASHVPVDLRVFYLWDSGVTPRLDEKFGQSFAWDVDLLSGYDSEFVPNVAQRPSTQHFGGLHNPSLPKRLRDWRPDAVLVFGYAYRTHLQLLRYPPAPLVFRGDSHLLGQASPPWTKRLALRWVYRRFAAITYVGQANRDYFHAFGVPDSKLRFAPHCVDHKRFTPTTEIAAAAERLRESLGIGGRRVVLFAGKLVQAKNPRGLLTAFRELAPADVSLVFVGDGAEKSALESDAAGTPHGAVHFLPFANQSEMPARYALADILALPSIGRYETWGLAVNEAMHMGRPCLVSNLVGCQRDLVTDGETGWVARAGDARSLRETLGRALGTSGSELTAMREAVARRISGYTYSSAATGLMQAVDAALIHKE